MTRECPKCEDEYEERVRPPNYVPDREYEYEEWDIQRFDRLCIERDGGNRDHDIPRTATLYLHSGDSE